MNFFKWLFSKKEPPKVKIGFALGSGGAKGYAELGAIKALEENGVIPDVLGGTSIGSIIGAFLANGYTATDIISLLETVNFKEITSFLAIGMSGAGLNSVIDRYLGDLKIEELKKPFVAVATSAETGEERVIKSGSVGRALCASSAYPPYFKPTVIDGERLVDGAFSNSVPADRVKELGADLVIGIDISNHKGKQSVITNILPVFKFAVDCPWEKGYKYSDVMLHPNLENYSATSFKDGAEMFEIGYKTALIKIPEIKAAIESFKVNKKRRK